MMSSDRDVLVSWQGGKCVSHYGVYQQAVTSPPNTDWEKVADLPNQAGLQHQVNIPGVPCTVVTYGVSAFINGEESEMVVAQETVNIPLTEGPYVATGLDPVVSSTSLEVSWDHPTCVDKYRVVACPQGPQGPQTDGCLDMNIEPEPGSSTVTGLLEQLSPCTDYQLDIFATSSGKENPGPFTSTFRTQAPAAVEPPNFSLNKLDLSFEPVECATKYKVYEKTGEDTEKVIKEIAGTSLSLAIPPSCSEYR